METLEIKCARYEAALKEISSIIKFEVPLEHAGPFLFKVCSHMRRIALNAINPPLLGPTQEPGVTYLPSRIHEKDASGHIVEEGKYELLRLEDKNDIHS